MPVSSTSISSPKFYYRASLTYFWGVITGGISRAGGWTRACRSLYSAGEVLHPDTSVAIPIFISRRAHKNQSMVHPVWRASVQLARADGRVLRWLLPVK